MKNNKTNLKVVVSTDHCRRYGHRKSTTSKNKLKDTPIKHCYHLEDYNRHVVYEHYYDEETLPFYVGEGTLQRAFVIGGNRRTSSYNEKVQNINLVKVKIVAIDVTIEEALQLETNLINKYKRINEGGSLINVDYKRGGGFRKSLVKPVYQFTKWGQFIAEYPSATAAAKALNLNLANICNCCNGVYHHETCGGFVFKYTKDYKPNRLPPCIKLK